MMKLSKWFQSVAVVIGMISVAALPIATADYPERAYTVSDIAVDDSDLDLSGNAGLNALYRRIQDAALKACDPDGEIRLRPLYNRPDSGSCYADTLNAALVASGNKSLRRIHDRLRRPPIIVN